MSQIRDPRAIEPLIAVLEDEWFSARKAAATALGKFGDDRAVKPLVAALKGENWAAIGAVGKISDARAVKPLVAVLKNIRNGARLHIGAIEALGQIGDARAVKPLVAALKHKARRVRRAAARALGRIGDERAAKPLGVLLQDKDFRVSEAAGEALAQLGKVGIDQLIPCLKDENRQIRVKVKEVLCEIEDRIVPLLISALVERRVGLAPVVDVLSCIGRSRAIGPLLAALNSEEVATRQAVVQVVDELDWRPEDGETLARYWIAKDEWGRCAKIGSAAVGPPATALGDEDQGVRRSAVRTLGNIGDARAVGPLVSALEDKDPYVRTAAVEALGKIGDESAIAPLTNTWITQWRKRCHSLDFSDHPTLESSKPKATSRA